MKELTDIKFYGAIEFAQLVLSLGPVKVLKDQGIRELFYCHPLMMNEVLKRKKRMSLGKIEQQNHPFDVVFVNEEDLITAHKSTNFYLKDPIWIQVKELRDNKNIAGKIFKTYSMDQWIQMVQNQINKIKTVMQPQGVLHIHNKLHFNSTDIRILEALLKTLKFPKSFPFTQVTLSIESAHTDGSNKGIKTWQIYPKVWPIGNIVDQSSRQLRKIYGLDA